MFMAILALVPGLLGVITKWQASYYDAKVKLVTARLGGDVTMAHNLVAGAAEADHENTSRLTILAGNKVLTLMLIGFATPIMIFEWKVIVWDVVLASSTNGSTDAIHGQVAEWMTTIISFLFGSATVMGIGRMYFGRDKTGE
jgi:hypothetical protein